VAPAAVAELLGVLLGVTGIALVGLTNVLHAASDLAARRRGSLPEAADTRLHEVLIALPASGFAAGVCLAASIAMYVIRGFLGAPLPLVLSVVAVDAFLLVVAARTVVGTTRLLYTHGREQAAAALRAETQATDARLSALQAQLNPHFLFNALNTVAALTRSDPRAAESTVEDLADVLRRTLARSTMRRSTLGDEIEYLRAYLGIEQQRMGERLRVEWDIPPELLPAPILPLALQPLVENALKHGIGARLSGGTIRVSARSTEHGTRIAIADDGDGFPLRFTEGTGLRKLRERLITAHGSSARLDVERPPSGASVAVLLPAAQEAAHASPDRR
jgi:two-component sensor histidine kinase